MRGVPPPARDGRHLRLPARQRRAYLSVREVSTPKGHPAGADTARSVRLAARSSGRRMPITPPGGPSGGSGIEEYAREIALELDHIFIYGQFACPADEQFRGYRCFACQV